MRLLRRHPGLLFLLAMGCGLLIGVLGNTDEASWVSRMLSEVASEAVDPLIMIMLTLLFLEVRFGRGYDLLRSRRAAAVALGLNFLVLPVVALGLTSVLIPDHDQLRLGVLIYLLFPCTDWYLGFTRVAGGNTALGTALIPVSLGAQLLLYPVWVSIATERSLTSVLELFGPALAAGLLVPAAAAALVRGGLRWAARKRVSGAVRRGAGAAVPGVIAALILCLFASGAGEVIVPMSSVMQIVLTVSAFFMISCVASVLVSRRCRLDRADLILVVMTTSARNAPLMLAATALTLGEHALITAAILLGMLMEFPHLALLTGRWRRRSEYAGERIFM